MNDHDTNWLAMFGYLPPTLDSKKHCRCKCHSVVRDIAGTVVIEGRLGVLSDPTDHVVACHACQIKHARAMWEHERKGAA